MTKDDWIDRCAARFVKKGGMNPEQADIYARTCWGEAVKNAGSEEQALTDPAWGPEESADVEMSYWAENAA